MLLLALLLLWARQPVETPHYLPPPSSFSVIFDNGNTKQQTVAAPKSDRETGSPPAAAPAPPPAPMTVPVPPRPVPEPPPVPIPESAAPAPLLPPRVDTPIPPLPETPIPEITAPPLPAPPARSASRAAHSHPAFPAPMEFSLASPSAHPSTRRRSGQGIALTFGSGVFGAEDTKVFGRSDSKEVGPDWFNRFSAWWDRHRYYPPQAGRNNEEGNVILDLVVARNGRVEKVRLTSGSGSQWLDMAALGVFRDATLPALPSDTAPTVPLTLTIHYQIIRN